LQQSLKVQAALEQTKIQVIRDNTILTQELSGFKQRCQNLENEIQIMSGN
jgi:hypothetical protein